MSICRSVFEFEQMVGRLELQGVDMEEVLEKLF